jgi:hypothetical protein
MNFDEKMATEMEEFNKSYKGELEEYSKIGNYENFKKIKNRLENLKKYDIRTIKNILVIKNDEVTVYFYFFSFNYTDHNVEIEKYLNYENYNLYASIDAQFINLNELNKMAFTMAQVKDIADEVIGGTDGN